MRPAGSGSTDSSYSRGLNTFARLTAAATFVLIFTGGLVTSTGSGLAVPDWPLSLGQFFPAMIGGVLFEHGHRLVAGSVGLLMLSLAMWIWRREPRILLRRVASLALAAVVLQALLGGLTVLMRLPVPVSVAHAGLAQVFFCLSVVLAVCTGRAWMHSTARATDSSRPSLKFLAWVSTGLIFGQLLLGAVMRHTGAGLAIPDFPLSFGRLLPPEWTLPIAIHFAHRVGALVVSVGVLWTVSQVERCHTDCPELLWPARLLGGLLVLQVCLGALTIWTARMTLPTTLHVSVGAALLATSLLIGLRAGRLLSSQRVSRMGAIIAEGGVA